MTHSFSRPNPPAGLRLATDADLQRHLSQGLRAASERQLWAFFLDETHRVLPPVIPMTDMPDAHDEWCDTDDLGLVSFAEMYVDRMRHLAKMLEAQSMVFVYERPGEPKLSPNDLGWLRGLNDHARQHQDVPRLRTLYLLHDQGLRQVAADDLLG